MELDDRLALAHRVNGTILHDDYWNRGAAEKEFARARELDGKGAVAYGVQSLIEMGRFDDAVAEAERLRRLDPLSINVNLSVAFAYRASGQYDRAVAEIERVLTMGRMRSRVHFQLGATFVMMGRRENAIRELETAIALSTQANPRYKAYLGYAYAVAGRPAEARAILEELESLSARQYISAFGLALIHDGLQEREPALTELDRAYADRAVEFAQMPVYPPFKTVASEPRFQAIMSRVGLGR